MNQKILQNIFLAIGVSFIIFLAVVSVFKQPDGLYNNVEYTTYRNDQYGFEIKFPSRWGKVPTPIIGERFNRPYFDFYVTDPDFSIFSIDIIDEKTWKSCEAEEKYADENPGNLGCELNFIAREGKNFFVWSRPNGEIGGDEYLLSDVPKVISTFKFIKKTSTVYTNTRLGYELLLPNAWHISEAASKKIDSTLFLWDLLRKHGCDIGSLSAELHQDDVDLLSKKISECVQKNGDFGALDQSYQHFLDSWNVENAQNIVITRLASYEERKINTSVVPAVFGIDWSKGSFILIAPAAYLSSFSEDRATTSNKAGLKLTHYILSDNIRAYVSDWRNTELTTGYLEVSVPFTPDEKMIYNGEGIESLIFRSTAQDGSKDEKVFFEVLQSFHSK